MQCLHCKKLAFETQHAAMRVVNGIRSRGGKTSGRAYRCPFGNWHITRITHEVKRVFRTQEYWKGTPHG